MQNCWANNKSFLYGSGEGNGSMYHIAVSIPKLLHIFHHQLGIRFFLFALHYLVVFYIYFQISNLFDKYWLNFFQGLHSNGELQKDIYWQLFLSFLRLIMFVQWLHVKWVLQLEAVCCCWHFLKTLKTHTDTLRTTNVTESQWPNSIMSCAKLFSCIRR